MIKELRKLYNTLGTIETKGAGTITMADCLRFLENLIKTEMEKEQAPAGDAPAKLPFEVEEETAE